MNKLDLIKDYLSVYACPLFILGNIDDLDINKYNVVSADCPKQNFIIFNRNPKWLNRALNNESDNNILIIKNFDKLSLEEQELFIDIICNNTISGEELPENLKIIINAEKECKLIPKIRGNVGFLKL